MRRFVFLSLLAAIACSDNAAVRQPRIDLDGTWNHVRGAQEPPGFFQQFSLATSDTTLMGVGTWTGEAGPSGGLAVTGYVSGVTIHLDFVFSYNPPFVGPAFTKQFVGVLSSPTDMIGTTTTSGPASAAEHFTKRQ